MKIFLTGATGFVGYHVARALAEEGAQLRLLVRKSSNLANIEGLQGDTHVGDLADPASIQPALEGIDAVVHVAADYRLWIPDPDAMYRANVDGTRELLKLASEANVPRVVCTSSVATMHFFTNGMISDEDTPVTLADMVGHYKRSKFLAEEAVRELAAQGAPVVIVNPSTPIGPRDVKPTPTGRVVRDAAAGRMPAFVDTGLNVAHVDDVAEGHLLAYRRGKLGERYVLGGDDMSLREILATIADITGRRAPKIQLPHAAVMPVAYFAEALSRFTGRAPVATVEEIRMSKKRMYFSCAKAKRELGYAPRPARAALEDAVSWFRDNGYL